MDMNEVKLIRLNSGEEILAKLENVDESSTKLTKPFIIIPTQQKSIALMAWVPYSNAQEEGIVVRNDFIAFTTEPHDELCKEYTTMVTGIELPSAGDVVATNIGKELLTED
tara:strand:+ start:123 stop:455 length:333 start_codon:yes stop_codon:yes gene_type:complete